MEPAGEHALRERRVGDQRDTVLAGQLEHAVGLDLAVEQADAHLVGREREALGLQRRTRLGHLPRREVADAHGAHLAGADERGHLAHLRGDGRAAPREVDLVQVDGVRREALDALVDVAADVARRLEERQPLGRDDHAAGLDAAWRKPVARARSDAPLP